LESLGKAVDKVVNTKELIAGFANGPNLL
jgi:hypothetical protein